MSGAGSDVALPPLPSSTLSRARFPHWASAGRLIWLFLLSRQIRAAAAILAGCALMLNVVGRRHGFQGEGALVQQVPVLFEAAVAAVIVVSTRSPFGENEVASGRLLSCLRVGATLAVTGSAIGLLAVASVGGHLPGGIAALTRNVGGLTGLGLVVATVLGAAVAWVGPVVYAAVTEYALTETWHTPWIWVARPPSDRGAWLCASLVLVAGVLLIAVRGPRATPE
jgi:hypothetical protein